MGATRALDFSNGTQLEDESRVKIEPMLPKQPPRPKGGRSRIFDRACLEGILFVFITACQWETLPPRMRLRRAWPNSVHQLRKTERTHLGNLPIRAFLTWADTRFVSPRNPPARKFLMLRQFESENALG